MKRAEIVDWARAVAEDLELLDALRTTSAIPA